MATNVTIYLATTTTYLDQFQSSVWLGGSRQIAPNITHTTWFSDGSSNTWLDLAYDGTNDFSSGAVLCNLADPTLSSGQAIGYLTATPTIPIFNASSELIIDVVNPATNTTSTVYWQQPSGAVVSPQTASPGRAYGFDWRTDINALRVQFNGYRGSGVTGQIFRITEFSLTARVFNRPTVIVSAPTSPVTTTSRPTISWSFAGDTLTQSHYRVRIFTAAQYGAGGFNPQTSTATIDTDWVASTNNYYTPIDTLVNGTTYRAYVMAAQTLPTSGYRHESVDGTTLAALGATQYSQFTISLAAPPVPTAIQPAAGSTVTNDRPTLYATLGASTVTGATVKAEWQLATDSGFTANVRTITQDDTERVTSGAVSKAWNSTSELFQGTWYIRAREIDSNNAAGNYSTAQTFTVAHAPSASTISPINQVSVPAGNISFSVGFSDTASTDYMTAYQIIAERNSDGFGILDTGKQAVTGAPTTASHTAAIATPTYNDVVLRWKARVWDSDDVVGSYTAYAQFVPRALPTITPVNPTASAVIGTPTPTFSFTVAGRTISQYRFLITYTSSGITHSDSGWRTGSTASFTLTTALINSTNFTVSMQVRDQYGLENTTSVNFSTLWNPPANPTISVSQTNFESNGTISVTWNQNRDASFIAYRLYAKKASDSTYTLLGETTVNTGASYTLTAAAIAANTSVNIAVTQVAYRFGVPVESLPSPVTTTLAGASYYLIGSTANIKLPIVKDDNFTDEWEQEEIKLIGRGRRVEKGTRYGYRGTLSAVVYDSDGVTAAQRRAQIEALRTTDSTCYLRTPFGDLWKVGLGDIQITRIAGVGLNEYFTVTVPYFEVDS